MPRTTAALLAAALVVLAALGGPASGRDGTPERAGAAASGHDPAARSRCSTRAPDCGRHAVRARLLAGRARVGRPSRASSATRTGPTCSS